MAGFPVPPLFEGAVAVEAADLLLFYMGCMLEQEPAFVLILAPECHRHEAYENGCHDAAKSHRLFSICRTLVFVLVYPSETNDERGQDAPRVVLLKGVFFDFSIEPNGKVIVDLVPDPSEGAIHIR